MAIPTWDSLQLVLEPTILGPDSIAQFNPYYYPTSQISEVHRLKQRASVDSWADPYSFQHSYNVEFNTQSYTYHHSLVHQYYNADLGFNPNQYGFDHNRRESHPISFPVPCAYHFESTNSGFYSVSETLGVSRGSKHKRRATSGKKNAWRKKQKYILGRRANTKLSSNITIRRIRMRGSKSLEVERKIEPVGNNADKVFDKCPERQSDFESKMLEFSQSCRRVEEMLQQMISSAKKQDNQSEESKIESEGANYVALEKEKISENDANQVFDNFPSPKSPQRDDMESINELQQNEIEVMEERKSVEDQLFDEIPQRANKISHEILIPASDSDNNDSIRNNNFKLDSEWYSIYELICNDYESHLVHINGGGEVLRYEGEENSENKEDQVPERYANVFLELSPQSNVIDSDNLDDEAPSVIGEQVLEECPFEEPSPDAKYQDQGDEAVEEFNLSLQHNQVPSPDVCLSTSVSIGGSLKKFDVDGDGVYECYHKFNQTLVLNGSLRIDLTLMEGGNVATMEFGNSKLSSNEDFDMMCKGREGWCYKSPKAICNSVKICDVSGYECRMTRLPDGDSNFNGTVILTKIAPHLRLNGFSTKSFKELIPLLQSHIFKLFTKKPALSWSLGWFSSQQPGKWNGNAQVVCMTIEKQNSIWFDTGHAICACCVRGNPRIPEVSVIHLFELEAGGSRNHVILAFQLSWRLPLGIRYIHKWV